MYIFESTPIFFLGKEILIKWQFINGYSLVYNYFKILRCGILYNLFSKFYIL